MRSLKDIGKYGHPNLIQGNCYMINNQYLFKYSGLQKLPNTKEYLIIGKDKLIDIQDRSMIIGTDPNENLPVILVKEITSIYPLNIINMDDLINQTSIYNSEYDI